jgi:hypothetical protein
MSFYNVNEEQRQLAILACRFTPHLTHDFGVSVLGGMIFSTGGISPGSSIGCAGDAKSSWPPDAEAQAMVDRKAFKTF